MFLQGAILNICLLESAILTNCGLEEEGLLIEEVLGK